MCVVVFMQMLYYGSSFLATGVDLLSLQSIPLKLHVLMGICYASLCACYANLSFG